MEYASTSDAARGAGTSTSHSFESAQTSDVSESSRLMSREDARDVMRVVREVSHDPDAVREMRDHLGWVLHEKPSVSDAWDAVEDRPDDRAHAHLQGEFEGCEIIDPEEFDDTMRAVRTGAFVVEVRCGKPSDTTRTWWRPEPRGDAAEQEDIDDSRGRVVLVTVAGGQVGDDNSQFNLHIHEIENPKIDYGSLMGDSAVAEALGQLSAAPGDPELRQAAVAALEQVPAPKSDWTEAYAGNGTAYLGSGAARLDGTVAIIHSKGVQVGNGQRQENTILHTASPEIAAEALLTHPELVECLVELACSPGDPNALVAFERTVSETLIDDLADSSVARQGHSSLHRPPPAGQTLRIEGATGVTVGERASQRTDFAQRAHLGRATRTGARRFAASAQEVAQADAR